MLREFFLTSLLFSKVKQMFIPLLIRAVASETVTVSAAGGSYKQLVKGDKLHVTIPEGNVAFVVFSREVEALSIDGALVTNEDSSKARAFMVTGSTMEYDVENSRNDAYIWVLPNDRCFHRSFWASGENYYIKADEFQSADNICFFPVSNNHASVLSYETSGSESKLYKGVDEFVSCSSGENCYAAADKPYFVQIPPKADRFACRYSSLQDDSFGDKEFGLFASASSQGITYNDKAMDYKYRKIFINYFTMFYSFRSNR